jgi:hypothetical protein
VDLGVVDPAAPGSYLLGIECDGHKYHTCPVARDRDRLRQQILEGLGWRIHRVWSTDWYRNRPDCERQILQAVERARAEPPPGPPPAGPLRDTPQAAGGAGEHGGPPGTGDPPSDIAAMVPDYEVCTHLRVRRGRELLRQPLAKLAKAVAAIVDVEGPVHSDEVVRRIRDYWGVRRAGSRIRAFVDRGVALAVTQKLIRKKGTFLWRIDEVEVPVRRRNDDGPIDIDLICDEEIAEAAKMLLRWQHGTPLDDLDVGSSRLLGFRSTREHVFARIESVIQSVVTEGAVTELANGMLMLASNPPDDLRLV